jgi:phosphatidylglycerophosphatase A
MKLINNCKTPKGFLKNPLNLIATGFGSGLSPIIPGTCGTLPAIPIYWLLHYLSLTYYTAIVIAITLISFWICDKTAKNLKANDPQCIVLDEIVGFLITMIAAPIGIIWIIIGFILFRLFDMLKPWPINWIDKKVHGGLGIVLDDVLAGIMATVVLHIIKYITI